MLREHRRRAPLNQLPTEASRKFDQVTVDLSTGRTPEFEGFREVLERNPYLAHNGFGVLLNLT